MITFSQLGNQGRLGNQLWQIAATVAAAKKYGVEYAFPKWEYEPYFNLHGCFKDHIPVSQTYVEPYFHFCPIPPATNTDLSGYFQSYKYFAEYEGVIRNIFEFSFSTAKYYGVASIHIRRGDYVTIGNDYHTNLQDSYYQQAISTVNAGHYLVFSDDIDWCKGKFTGQQYSFVQGNSPAEDMALMARCDHNIIANSSFSWWAAYLNKNVNKKVIAPKNWFGPKLPHDTKDLIPPGWITI